MAGSVPTSRSLHWAAIFRSGTRCEDTARHDTTLTKIMLGLFQPTSGRC